MLVHRIAFPSGWSRMRSAYRTVRDSLPAAPGKREASPLTMQGRRRRFQGCVGGMILKTRPTARNRLLADSRQRRLMGKLASSRVPRPWPSELRCPPDRTRTLLAWRWRLLATGVSMPKVGNGRSPNGSSITRGHAGNNSLIDGRARVATRARDQAGDLAPGSGRRSPERTAGAEARRQIASPRKTSGCEPNSSK